MSSSAYVHALCIACIVAPFAYVCGRAAGLLRLPQITGYLISGIICGPYVLGILTGESVADLSVVESACLSIIGLAAGAELDWTSLARAKKQVRLLGQKAETHLSHERQHQAGFRNHPPGHCHR